MGSRVPLKYIVSVHYQDNYAYTQQSVYTLERCMDSRTPPEEFVSQITSLVDKNDYFWQ
jgi:hypothetical protein